MTFTERYMRLMHSPASRKVVLLSGLLLPLHMLAWLRISGLQDRLDEPVTRALEALAGQWLAAATGLLTVAAIARWRGRTAEWSAYLFTAVYAGFTVAFMHAEGIREPVMLFLIPASALLLAVWFDERVGGTHLLLCMAFIVLDIIFRDAPAAPPSAAAIDAVSRGTVLVAFLLLITDFLLCILVLSVHRLLETRLNQANRDLDRTQRLIRRYVPAQLAERIEAGGHSEGAKHERRKLTLVFSDVVGFTDLSDELDAEELAAFLNEYLSEMTVIADRFGATVNQLVGDGMMIFFGAPTATDDRDHALRAVRMAIEMQRHMAALRDVWFRRGLQRPFQVRIGINTGFASVGDFGSPGRMMYSAIGQQTNLAARIQSQCPPGQVLISHSTWALVHDAIPCAPKGEINVKGLHYPMLVYQVAELFENSRIVGVKDGRNDIQLGVPADELAPLARR